MSISEEKTNIVINSYFKTECSVDTTIREAFEKGFRLGIKKVKAQERQWVPCSERLPSDSGNYLITVADLRLGHNGEHTVAMADFYAKAKKWNSIVDVVAWMPLPKPYREDGEA